MYASLRCSRKSVHRVWSGFCRDFHGGSGEGKDGNLSRSISNLSAEEMQLSQGAAAKRKGRFQIVDDPDAKVSGALVLLDSSIQPEPRWPVGVQSKPLSQMSTPSFEC